MINKNQRSLDKILSWNTKYLVLVAFILVIFGFAFNNIELGLAIVSVIALSVVIIIDYFELLAHRHPITWKYIRFIIVAIVILFTLIGWNSF